MSVTINLNLYFCSRKDNYQNDGIIIKGTKTFHLKGQMF